MAVKDNIKNLKTHIMKTIEFEVSERIVSVLFTALKVVVIAALAFVAYKGLFFAFASL